MKAGEFKIKNMAAGGAAPSTKLNQVFGPRGLNAAEFCKNFNALTQGEEKDLPMSVKIKFADKKIISFRIGLPSTSYFLKRALNVEKGSSKPGRTNVEKKLTAAQIEEIARKKMVDMNTDDLSAAYKMVAGTARSSGIEIEE